MKKRIVNIGLMLGGVSLLCGCTTASEEKSDGIVIISEESQNDSEEKLVIPDTPKEAMSVSYEAFVMNREKAVVKEEMNGLSTGEYTLNDLIRINYISGMKKASAAEIDLGLDGQKELAVRVDMENGGFLRMIVCKEENTFVLVDLCFCNYESPYTTTINYAGMEATSCFSTDCSYSIYRQDGQKEFLYKKTEFPTSKYDENEELSFVGYTWDNGKYYMEDGTPEEIHAIKGSKTEFYPLTDEWRQFYEQAGYCMESYADLSQMMESYLTEKGIDAAFFDAEEPKWEVIDAIIPKEAEEQLDIFVDHRDEWDRRDNVSNYTRYVFGDFNNNGRIELITSTLQSEYAPYNCIYEISEDYSTIKEIPYEGDAEKWCFTPHDFAGITRDEEGTLYCYYDTVSDYSEENGFVQTVNIFAIGENRAQKYLEYTTTFEVTPENEEEAINMVWENVPVVKGSFAELKDEPNKYFYISIEVLGGAFTTTTPNDEIREILKTKWNYEKGEQY